MSNNKKQFLYQEYPPVSSVALPFQLILPYLTGVLDNFVFSFFAVVPILEKKAEILSPFLENTRTVRDKKLTVLDLQATNGLLNKSGGRPNFVHHMKRV